jgi:hypothetical protein
MDANMKEINTNMDTNQAEIKSTADALQEKMEPRYQTGRMIKKRPHASKRRRHV